MGEKNLEPVFAWVREKIKICNSDIGKRILHGLELRGRTHPEELFPIIKDITGESLNKETEKMLIHIIGQINYKKVCLEKVTAELKTWENKTLVAMCKKEIILVHKNYERFSFMTHKEAEKYMVQNLM